LLLPPSSTCLPLPPYSLPPLPSSPPFPHHTCSLLCCSLGCRLRTIPSAS
jgi:hypothetical protein